MKFYMLRFYTQLAADGVTIEDKTATYVHNDKTAAMKQYYKMLSSDIDDTTKLTVLCMVVDGMGNVVAKQRFDHQPEAEVASM